MNLKQRIAIVCVCAMLFAASCSQPKTDNWRSQRAAHYKGFLIKWAEDDTLSISELKKHTLLNLTDYPGTHQFQFDSVYYPESNHPLAIITCDENRVCMDYFLLVLDGSTLKNTAIMQVKRDCDTDGDEPQTDLDFKLVNDSEFYTEDVYVKNADDTTADSVDVNKITAKHYFKIGVDGSISAATNK